MSNTSIRPIPTLRGMFSVPRAVQGRNFLKENKLSLRSLEKATTEKLAAKEPVRPKWMPPLRRTASETREFKRYPHVEHEKAPLPPPSVHYQEAMHQQQEHNVAVPGIGERFDGLGEREPVDFDPQTSHCRATGQYNQRAESSSEIVREPHPSGVRCKSCGTERSAASIGIQTEDIMDETYLTNALKKCNFDGKSTFSDGRSMRSAAYEDNYDEDQPEKPLSARSNDTNAQLQAKRQNYPAHDFEDDGEPMPMPEFSDLTNVDGLSLNEEAPLSARSRATLASNATSKSKRREHKLGSRDELRLPRYLEKEKRDKAEAVQRMKARDPDCPRGHVMLSEQDRLTALAEAKQRFSVLVNELNHMPLTTQTLRVRTRKAEIDKELTTLEEDIRVYSKPKVFIKASKSRNI